jgi:EAL domain-containing protein (putative c-di-GMP-specific phosphodiesterase class I)
MVTTSSTQALAAVGLDDADRAALRAFALAVATAPFESAFTMHHLARARDAAPVMTAEAAFVDVLLKRVAWTEPEWLDALAEAWVECLRCGAPPLLPARAASALIEAVRDTLGGDGRACGRAEWDILSSVEKLTHAATARLASTTLEELCPQRQAGEGIDPATGLPTRQRFVSLLETWLEGPGRDAVGLLLLHFEWGASGQQLLTSQRDRLRRVLSDAMGPILRADDVLCAIGDHEWALLMPDLRNNAQILLAARRLIESCERAIDGSFPQLRARIHVGGARSPEDGTRAQALEHSARAALHSALRDNLPVATFRAEMLAAMEYELELEHDIAHSMLRPPFEIWLQPQISLATGRCESAEALLRWCRNGGEWISPQRLIDIASRLQIMPALSRWLITQVVRMTGELAAAGADIRVALNLVASDLHDEDLPPLVAQTLAAWRVPPHKLCLEVTEGALIGDHQRAAAIIERLRAQGCGVALDDFGTGFSSLGYLRDLPFSELKIDQVFVRHMRTSGHDRAIVTAVLALARGFQMDVVAEGVEDQGTADELQRMGCDHAQGYLYAHAVPQREFVNWVRARNRH